MITDYGAKLAAVLGVVRNTVNELIMCFSDRERILKRLPDWRGRRGGCFCLMDRKTGQVLLLAFVGVPPREKMDKYQKFALEKAKRLFRYPEHTTSWESRNPKKNQWGGAVAGEEFIYSFSGLPEDGDTLAMSKVAGFIEKTSPSIHDLVPKKNIGVFKLLKINKRW